MSRQQLNIVLERQSRYLECVQLHSVLNHYEFDQNVSILLFLKKCHILTAPSFKVEQKVCRLDVGLVCAIYERLKVQCFEVTHSPPLRSWKGFLLSSVDCSSSTFSLMEMSNQGSVLVPASYLVDNDEQLDEKRFPLISFAS